MPLPLTYPGVYIEEIASGVRTITGVATSIAAFVGRTLRGPVNEPTVVGNFGEFQRTFGGLAADHTVAYAVRDFFANGGAQALILRLYTPLFADDDARTSAFNEARTSAETAAVATRDAAVTAKGLPGATPASVVAAAAAGAATAAAAAQAATPGALARAALLAGEQVVAAARTESTRRPYVTLDITGSPTGGTIKLKFKAAETAAIPLGDLIAEPGSTAADALKAALEGLTSIGAGKISSVVRSGATPNVSFLVDAGGMLNGPPDVLVVSDSALTGGSTPMATVVLRPNADSVAGAATAAVSAAEDSAALKVAPNNRARLTLDNGLILEAATPGAWGNFLSVSVDSDTQRDDDGNPNPALYNLTITDRGTNRVERIRNVSGTPGAVRLVSRVLADESSLLRVVGSVPEPSPSLGSVEVNSTGESGDSSPLSPTDFDGTHDNKAGLFALDKADLFNLLCVPPDTRDGDTPVSVYQMAMGYCNERRAMLIVDSPAAWSANPDVAASAAVAGLQDLQLHGPAARNAALFFPRVKEFDPVREGQIDTFVPCGAVAGIFARTDSTRGVWKAPAGLDAAVNGIAGLQVNLTDGDNGRLNPLGINSIRSFPATGQVLWGARTLRGADSMADEYKYIPVRRFALFLEESLYRGTQWVVFEPNDEPLWAQIRLNIGAFMQNLFRQGAFQGKAAREAYFVKCDRETTTQTEINLGVVNIMVGFAPLKPAEFVIIKLQQMAGDIPT